MTSYKQLMAMVLVGSLTAMPAYAQVASSTTDTSTQAAAPADSSMQAPAADTSAPASPAQADTSTPTPATTPVQPSPDAPVPAPSASSTTASDTGSVIQSTAVLQAAAPAEALLTTANPQLAASTTDATEATTSAASDVSVATTTATAATSPTDETSAAPFAANTATSAPMPLPQTQPTVVAPVDPAPEPSTPPMPIVAKTITVLPVKTIEDEQQPIEPHYRFALTGKTIAAVRSDGGHATVSQPLTTTVDQGTGAATVSGQCSGAYYVVLLYKNQTDYVNDRRSYLVNRAYPCVGGSFTYAISELPSTLDNGTYYLLVGQESSSGVWQPITALTEVTISH